MIETWGTEIALVIAVLGTALINLMLRKTESMEYLSIRLLLRACNTFTIVTVLLYGYLATKGVSL